MKIPANKLPGHLKQPLLPCYLVSGDEPLLVQEALDAIRGAAREQGYSDRDLYVQMAGFDWRELAGAGSNLSLFATRRLVELRLPTGKPGRDGGAAITELAERAGDDIVFVISAPKLDRNAASAKWVKSVESRGGFVQVWPVGLRELPGWINARMRSRGLRPDPDAVRMIADRVEGNLLAADQEIEKLRLLHGDGAVSADDVVAAVSDSSRFDVYQLADAALAGDVRRALRILAGVRAEGIDAVVVVWALTRELRVLAKLAAAIEQGTNLGSAMQRAGVWKNRENLVRACVGRHRLSDLHRLIQAGREADAAAKGQSDGDAWQLLTNIIWQLAAGARAAA
ncbi:MAG: DNA polymerase III subunit delta [Gammaproteobacteria bacterium]|nr:DNA polymerase III subunit delta [Gammaproteobacteria bacterium]MDH4253855.1 DNA polymerase III subunit delta [Gammaproteobacteria bacterium]MDH5310448.1 DNA polymerase III subunit delta [Gammaproteobacteria bacterium]